ncbi:hypothetical protein DJ71_10755 [Halorubrum sp. E3]|nr:hypothetical protein DJ71_10755 [Halorubrum sp. E3]
MDVTSCGKSEQPDSIGLRPINCETGDGMAIAVEAACECSRLIWAHWVEATAAVPRGRPRGINITAEYILCTQVIFHRL